MGSNFFNFLLIAGAIQGFIFNSVTLLSKKKVDKVIIFLNLTVFFLSLNNLQAWLIAKEFRFDIFFLRQFLVPWYMFIMPMFYMFLIHYLKIQDKVKGFLTFAIVLFVIELISRTILIMNTTEAEVSLIKSYTSIEEIVNAGFSIFLFYKCLEIVFKKGKLLDFIVSYDDIKWLKLFLILGGFVLSFWILAIVLNNFFDDFRVYYPLRLATSILLYWIGYQGFFRYTLVHDRILLRGKLAELKPETAQKPVQQTENGLSEKHQQEFESIANYIIAEQRFLDAKLGLDQLSDELEISAGHLSKLINTYSEYNFSDYINSLRVSQAKALLKDDDFDNYTIVAIGLECGFNSRSTFYTAFKKFTDLTPSEYRKAN
ncbi:helix-turn-helix transcriptional regulator [Kordia sp. YSTF-M3]|uniref:Helix-turn-helix transcriptional regulator n=1 Tax=Kordia aestuariivivens TaxID=2759037 RepID=A0ABR7Q4E1_9FLAO|nr:helix-turn-helix transcriptional regulator [Kordia aestuariivivens]MBC8753429.1 helix-turn-helix transcriptional regulator [Kordia aestuariivivens]